MAEKTQRNSIFFGEFLQMGKTINYMYKPFDKRISKRISTPISETFLCENVTVTYTA